MSSPETSPDRPTAEGPERIGMLISGRYLIRELLGEGGMGSVYLAEHTHMKKRVALKLLHPEMIDNAEVSARFEREAMASAHIEHPNVAAATDFGKTEDGTFYLVLEYVEGTDLRKALADGPLSVTRALRITRQIALALERAHETGIVHRDLKPENVMLMKKDNEPDFVKVLDFGIAKVLEGAASASAEIAKRNGGANQPLTRLGTILGTPEYMAPEQALGEAVTPAADLYAVGVLLYEMLTGKHPFDPPDRMAMLSFHIVAPVPLMQDRAPDVDVPAMVEAIARCLLEKVSNKRYANARALIDAIDTAGAVCGIDVGGVPNPVPSQGGWTGSDAFAKTTFGVAPDPAATTASGGPALVLASTNTAQTTTAAGEGRISQMLGRQPRKLLFVMAAAVPLFLVLVVVLVVLALRTPKVDGPQGPGGSGSTQAAKEKTAPADRLKTAVALGPEALEALAKEYPEDAFILRKLVVAYQLHGKSTEAIRTVRALLVVDPSTATDDEMVQLVTTVAAKGQGEADDDAFALLEGPFGERGVDALIELTARGPGKEIRDLRARATKSLAKPDVRAHASPAASVLLDFKAATSCGAKRDLMTRAKDNGDARLLSSLKPLKATRGCGLFSRADCWPCLRKEGGLDEAITAIEARPGGK